MLSDRFDVLPEAATSPPEGEGTESSCCSAILGAHTSSATSSNIVTAASLSM